MTYFDCFLAGSWMLAIGWFLGAIWMQNHNEETQISQVSETPGRCPECESWRVPVAARAAD
jgi:hypothetical protein